MKAGLGKSRQRQAEARKRKFNPRPPNPDHTPTPGPIPTSCPIGEHLWDGRSTRERQEIAVWHHAESGLG